MGKPISRVLYSTIIYLGLPLLTGSSDLPSGRWRATTFRPCLVLLRVGFTRPTCLQIAGGLLPHHFTLTTALSVSAVCFCCTFPIVTYAGRYPAPLPYGARTFLMLTCDCLAYPKHCKYNILTGINQVFPRIRNAKCLILR